MKTLFNRYNVLYYLAILFIFVFSFSAIIKLYCANFSLYLDESMLALNVINRSIFNLTPPLDYSQAAPFLFLVMTKINTKIFSNNELTLRLIPFLASIGSIIIFLQILNRIFKSKISKLLALLFFSTNPNVITYSAFFKQYSTDIFFTLLIILMYLKLDFEKISNKKLIIYSCILAFAMMMSYTAVFINFAILFIFLILHIKKINIKKIIYFVSFQILSLIFIFLSSLNSLHSDVGLNNYWQTCFLTFDNFLENLIFNINYFFNKPKYKSFFLILFLISSVLFFIKSKKQFLLIVFPIFFIMILSFLHFYPFSTRLILFLCPLFIINLFKPLDFVLCLKNKIILSKLFTCFIIFITFIAFKDYNLNYFKTIQMPQWNENENTKRLLKIYKNRKNKTEKIFVMRGSDYSFNYYQKLSPIKNENVIYDEQLFSKIPIEQTLNNLSKNEKKVFILFVSKDALKNRYTFNDLIYYLTRNAKTYKVYGDSNGILCHVEFYP